MTKRIVFVELMGAPGSYDASVYDHFEDTDEEGVWFQKRFGHVGGLSIERCNPCVGQALPKPAGADGFVLAGTYNSVHDHTDWQRKMRAWLPKVRDASVPTLAICGSHQLVSHVYGSDVEKVADGPFAGTFPISLSEHGRSCPLFEGVADGAEFQYGNAEHVVDVPKGGTLLASSAKVPVAALDFGNHFYSTQFHPEGTHETLSTVWRFSAPDRMNNYRPEDNGRTLVENFLRVVLNQ
jgi:GMP synthase (glutamine-hydrolysing)